MKIVIIGAGASGVVTSIFAKKDNNEVIVLEHNDKPLKKLLLTGNGKCNYFNDEYNSNKYFSFDRELLNDIINSNTKEKLLNFYDSIGLIPRVRNGYYYPASNQSYTVYNALMKEANNKGVIFKYNYDVNDIKYENNKYIINNDIVCDKLVISTGSYAYPKTGSNGSLYEIIKSLNIKINKVFPSLVALKSNDKILKNISGVRSEGKVSLYRNNELIDTEMGEIQFSEEGLSGICIYNLSINMYSSNYKVVVNFLNDFNIDSKNCKSKLFELDSKLNNRNITELLECFLNYKIVNSLLKKCNINEKSELKNIENNKLNDLIKLLCEYEFDISDTKGYDYSQVCSGGVSLKEINTNTFESLKYKGLYFTGEILDVTGKCGGYNLSFAFLSGMIVGESIND